MNELKNKAFDIAYGLYNRDVLSSSDYETIRDGLEEVETLRERDEYLEEMWRQFGDIPMNPETECMEDQFLEFPAGTYREDIWHWFDERHSRGVAYLLYCGAGDYAPEAKRLYCLSKLCGECESLDCCFNHDGKCRFALVYEKQPTITEEDGCADYTYREEDTE